MEKLEIITSVGVTENGIFHVDFYPTNIILRNQVSHGADLELVGTQLDSILDYMPTAKGQILIAVEQTHPGQFEA